MRRVIRTGAPLVIAGALAAVVLGAASATGAGAGPSEEGTSIALAAYRKGRPAVLRIQGSLTGELSGRLDARSVEVRLQRRAGDGRWHTVGTAAHATTDDEGEFGASFPLGSAGVCRAHAVFRTYTDPSGDVYFASRATTRGFACDGSGLPRFYDTRITSLTHEHVDGKTRLIARMSPDHIDGQVTLKLQKLVDGMWQDHLEPKIEPARSHIRSDPWHADPSPAPGTCRGVARYRGPGAWQPAFRVTEPFAGCPESN